MPWWLLAARTCDGRSKRARTDAERQIDSALMTLDHRRRVTECSAWPQTSGGCRAPPIQEDSLHRRGRR